MRRISFFLLGSSVALSLFLIAEPEASACGGCAVPPDTSTQVTGHRMILATSKTRTTLYDQIEYVGEPESFAWFLPIAGEVDIGLSSDALFAFLADSSQVIVYPPPSPCSGFRNNFGSGLASDEATSGGESASPEQDVNVIAQEVVGPYETVQIESKTPGALAAWLESHGFGVPADVGPIIDSYQAEGFGFLAMKLVPGEGVTSMRPVRVSTPGGSLALPLRMVAAGTGAVTPVSLHVVSEGRYEVVNRPNVRVQEKQLLWDWNANLSNYRLLRDFAVDTTNGFAWLTETSLPFSKEGVVTRAEQLVANSPGTSGWGDAANDVSELDDAMADIDTLFAGMDPKSTWLTRMYARLTRDAMADDLVLGASMDQSPVPRSMQATLGIGKAPSCGGGGLSCSVSVAPALTGDAGPSGGVPPWSGDRSRGLVALTGLAAALAFVRRRRN